MFEQNRRFSSVALGSVAVGALLWAPAVWAQAVGGQPLPVSTPAPQAKDAPSSRVDDIVVTAQRREERLQNTPIAVTALSSANLEARGIQDITQLTSAVPNLNLISSDTLSASSTALVFIRGIGQPQVFIQNDPGVGIYVDGVYIGRSQGAIFNTLDLERIEVLRGPQGTLYGRNTIGGAINLIGKRPGPGFGGQVGIEIGNYGKIDSTLKLNVPLSSKVFGSLAFSQTKHDGYVRPLASPTCRSCSGDPLSNDNTWAARVALRALATDTLTLDLNADYTHRRNRPIGIRLLSYDGQVPPFSFIYSLPVTFFHQGQPPESFADPVPNTHQSGFTGYDNQNVYGTSFTAEWRSPIGVLKSISAYRGLHVSDQNDGDGSPLAIFSNASERITQDQYSQEIQLQNTAFDGKLEFILGGFGYREHATSVQNFAAFLAEGTGFQFFPFPQPGCFNLDAPPYYGCPGMDGGQFTTYDVSNLAAFSNGTFHITDKLSATAGLRYSYEHKRLRYVEVGGPSPSVDDKQSFGSWTPRFGLSYQASKDVLLYASYAQGYKSGNFNQYYSSYPTLGPPIVQPETAKAYELGLKTTSSHQRLLFNVAGFYTNYSNQQLQVTGAPPAHAFVNAAQSRIYGVEVELQARPADFLRLDASLGYTHTEITKVTPGTFGVTQGSRLPFVPELTANFSSDLILPVGSGAKIDLRGEIQHLSSQTGDNQNTPNLITPARTLGNVRLSYLPRGRGLEIYAFVNNVADTRYRTATGSVFPALFTIGVDGPPRTFGVGARYRF